MDIIFGMFSDDAAWSQNNASLGEIVCGPGMFLDLLEQKTGLSGVPVSAPERINEYMQKIGVVFPDWCRESFQLDKWSTAKQMLAMRDDLCLNGWNKSDAPSRKMKALEQIESSLLALSPGIPDRMAAVYAELENFTFRDTLYLTDDFDLLPGYWQKIICKLEECGMKVVQKKLAAKNNPDIIKVEGADEFALAEELCRFLSAGGSNSNVAVICEGKSEILDGVLHRSGQGMIGNTEPSRWRESLQILPLWLETMWKPFNPMRFLELLTLEHSPIPKIAARELAEALKKEPGIGGEAWQTAWQNIYTAVKENKFGFYDDTDAECTKFEELRNFLENKCFNSETGVLDRTLIERCEFLEKRLNPQVEKHPELAIVLSHTKTLKKISADKGIIDKMTLIRMLDSIVSTGTASQSCSQVTTFTVFSHPGMLQGEFDTILWWNCINCKTKSNFNWSDEESAVLPYFDRAKERKLENDSWQKAKYLAKNELICFIPQSVCGEAVYPHALLDEPEIVKISPLYPHTLVDDSGVWTLGRRQKQLKKESIFEPHNEAFSIKNNIAPTRALSFSQIDNFITCPTKWLLKDYLGLQMPPALSLPHKSMMMGTLAHKVVELLYQEKETITAAEAKEKAGKIFDKLISEMAAVFLLDENKLEKIRFRETLVNSISTLVAEINTRKLLVKSCEKELSGTFEGMKLTGYCDIYLEDAAGNGFVIDMKWSTSADYEDKVNKNKALQLATYANLLSPEDMDIQCAYYLFPKQQFLQNRKKEWAELWENARSCWNERMNKLHSGVLEKGISESKDLKDSTLSLPQLCKCEYCEFRALCSIMED